MDDSNRREWQLLALQAALPWVAWAAAVGAAMVAYKGAQPKGWGSRCLVSLRRRSSRLRRGGAVRARGGRRGSAMAIKGEMRLQQG